MNRWALNSPPPVSTHSAHTAGVGCGLVLDIITDPETGRRKAAKSSGLKTHPTNFGRLCTKGTTTADMLAGPGAWNLHIAVRAEVMRSKRRTWPQSSLTPPSACGQ